MNIFLLKSWIFILIPLTETGFIRFKEIQQNYISSGHLTELTFIFNLESGLEKGNFLKIELPFRMGTSEHPPTAEWGKLQTDTCSAIEMNKASV